MSNFEELENLFYNAFQREDIDALVEIIKETSLIVEPAHARGAINPDFIQINQSDLSSLACMQVGLKEVSLVIGNNEIYTKIVKLMGLKFHRLRYNNNDLNKGFFDGIVYTNKGRKNAVLLWEFLEQDPVKNDDYHQIVGRCLGYPQIDIDFFCNGGSRTFIEKGANKELISLH
jgi:hypothetical protein